MKKTIDLEKFAKHFEQHDKLGSLLGNRLISISTNECVCEYQVSKEHFNPNQILHGGVLFAIMDSSQGAFVHFSLDEKFKAAATGTATVKYLAPVTSGKIRVRTWLKNQDGRKIFVDSEALDESGKTVATLEEIWIGILK